MSHRCKELEIKLAQMTGRNHCIYTSRGTAATYAFLKAIGDGQEGGRVVLPDILCPSMANAVIYAGMEPIFCDVNLDNYTISLEALEHLFENYDNIKAVIPVHLYGHIANMDSIIDLCAKYDAMVLEDAAQAFGAYYNEKPVGSFGHASFFSFGHTKTLDAGGGAAILIDDEVLATRIRAIIEAMPDIPLNMEERVKIYRKTYYSLYSLTQEDPNLDCLYLQMPDIFKDIYMFHRADPELAGRISDLMENLDTNIAHRRKIAEIYRQELTSNRVIHPVNTGNEVFWRYSFLIDSDLAKLTENLRSSEIDVSNWYPPLHNWYHAGRSRSAEEFKNSNYLKSHIMNLWTDNTINEDKATANARYLNKLLEGGE